MSQKTIDYILYNADIPIARLTYQPSAQAFIDIPEFYQTKAGPVGLFRSKPTVGRSLRKLNIWMRERSIPVHRDGGDEYKLKMGKEDSLELLMQSYALSLSDCYWLKPVDVPLTWDTVNFFQNDFDYLYFADSAFDIPTEKGIIEMKSPDFATGGNIRKSWVIDSSGRRVLLKGSIRGWEQIPFNERLATLVGQALHMDVLPYSIRSYKERIVSACPCFITPRTELVSARDFLHSKDPLRKFDEGERFVYYAQQEGIQDIQKKLNDLCLLDALLMNEDRHMLNFGLIRDVHTLRYIGMAPIYDTGNSMCFDQGIIQPHSFSLSNTSRLAKYFDSQISFYSLLKKCTDLSQYDLSCLYDVADQWAKELDSWKSLSQMTDSHIQMLVNSWKNRVKEIEQFISTRKIGHLK